METIGSVNTSERPLILREAIADRIRLDIITGKLAPGSYIKENKLAASLEISPTPVREACMQLAGEGLIEIQPSKRKRIAPISIKAVTDLLVVQRALWDLVCRLGVPKLTADDIARLYKYVEEFRAGVRAGDSLRVILIWQSFTSVVVAATGNKELLRAMKDRSALINRLVFLYMPAASIGHLRSIQLLAAVLSRRDVGRVLKLMRGHLDRLQKSTWEMADTQSVRREASQ